MIDVFKVGVHIGMTTNSSQVIATMMRELLGVRVAAGEVEKSLHSIGKAALGAAAVFVGWEVGKSILHAIEHNRELNRELEKTKQLGGIWVENIGAVRSQAIQTQMDAPTTTYSNNVRLAREIGMTLGHPDAALPMLTEAAKAAFVVSHATGENQETIMKNIMRTADSRGHIFKMGADGKEHVDPAMLHEEIEAASKALILGQGFITSGDLLQAAKMGGLASRGQSAGVFYPTITESSIMLGASKTGVAETGLIQQFIGGTMTKKVAEHLTEAGLLHPGEWHSGKSGGVVVKAGVAQRFAGVNSDPQAYFSTGEGAAAIKHYAEKNHITNMMAILQLFGRQTTQRLVADFMGNAPQFERAREIFGGIGSISSQYKELMAHDIDANMIAVSAAWKSFMEAFSDAGAPLVITILHDLTAAIQFLAHATAEHPETARALILLAGGISALTVLGGSITIFMVAWAPFLGGIRLLVGMSATIATVGTGLGAVAAGFAAIAGPLSSIVGLIGLGVGSDAYIKKQQDDINKNNPYGPMGHNPFTKRFWLGSPTANPDTVKPGEDHPTYDRNYQPNKPGKQSWNSNGVMVVHVANAGDIGRHISGGMADGTSRPQSGPTYEDYRYGLPSPGFAIG